MTYLNCFEEEKNKGEYLKGAAPVLKVCQRNILFMPFLLDPNFKVIFQTNPHPHPIVSKQGPKWH